MATYFEQHAVTYIHVPIDANGGINTEKFLEATESMIKLFDVLNGTAFSPVKSDMTGNVNKIRTRYLENPAQNVTLQSLVQNEKSAKKQTATEGLLWLKRGLEFTSQALRRNVDNTTEELSTSFNKAYEVTLSKHHSFLIRPVFSLAMKACPHRQDFYTKLGADQSLVQKHMSEWLTAFEKNVSIISKFYVDEKLEKIN